MRKLDPLGWLAIVITAASMLFLGMVMRDAWGQDSPIEPIIPVPESQLKQLLAEHLAALTALDEAQREVARLKIKLGCA